MSSKTNIQNRALALIGAKRIISSEDITNTAQLVRDTYDDIRTALLQAHTWPFCTFTDQMAQEAGTRSSGPLYSYRKPAANDLRGPLLRTVGIFTDLKLKYPAIGYIDAGPVVYADQTLLYHVGIFDIEEADRMSPLFRETLAFKLAGEWALPLSNSGKLMNDYRALAEAGLSRAKIVADMEGPPQQLPASAWEASRFGGPGGGISSSIFEDPTVVH